jgi:hypothetical protein
VLAFKALLEQQLARVSARGARCWQRCLLRLDDDEGPLSGATPSTYAQFETYRV